MPTTATDKQLAQRNLTTTSDTVIYKNDFGISQVTYLKTIIVCNLTALATTYSIWVNQNGSVSGDQFALIKNIPLAANASDQRIYPGDASIILKGSNATLIAKCGTANAVTVTLYGTEVLET